MTLRDRLTDREISVGLAAFGVAYVAGTLVTILSLPDRGVSTPGEATEYGYNAAYLPVSETMILVPALVLAACLFVAYRNYTTENYFADQRPDWVAEPDEEPAADGFETTDWPTPSFKMPGEGYSCARCDEYQIPNEGDIEAGLLIAGDTTKLCGDCARHIRDKLRDEGDELDQTERERIACDLVEEGYTREQAGLMVDRTASWVSRAVARDQEADQ